MKNTEFLDDKFSFKIHPYFYCSYTYYHNKVTFFSYNNFGRLLKWNTANYHVDIFINICSRNEQGVFLLPLDFIKHTILLRQGKKIWMVFFHKRFQQGSLPRNKIWFQYLWMIKTELKKQLSLRKSNTVDLFVHWVPLTTSKNRQGILAIVLGSRYNWLFNITCGLQS